MKRMIWIKCAQGNTMMWKYFKILALIPILKFYLNICVGFAENMRIFSTFWLAGKQTNKQKTVSFFIHT